MSEIVPLVLAPPSGEPLDQSRPEAWVAFVLGGPVLTAAETEEEATRLALVRAATLRPAPLSWSDLGFGPYDGLCAGEAMRPAILSWTEDRPTVGAIHLAATDGRFLARVRAGLRAAVAPDANSFEPLHLVRDDTLPPALADNEALAVGARARSAESGPQVPGPENTGPRASRPAPSAESGPPGPRSAESGPSTTTASPPHRLDADAVRTLPVTEVHEAAALGRFDLETAITAYARALRALAESRTAHAPDRAPADSPLACALYAHAATAIDCARTALEALPRLPAATGRRA